MRFVACLATLGLDWHVFEDERALQVAVTLETDRILRSFGTKRAVERRAVRIVTIRAANQSLIHAMAERLVEVSGFFRVALIAKGRLLGDQ